MKYQLVAEVKAGESTETLLSLLDQIDDVEGLYLYIYVAPYTHAPPAPVDKIFLDALFKKTKDVSNYLKIALKYEHVTDYLISRSTDFKGCFSEMLLREYSHLDVGTVLENATDVEGCLLWLLKSQGYQDFLEFSFYTLVSKTIDFDGCLHAALQDEYVDWWIADVLAEKTTSQLEECLTLALEYQDVSFYVIEKLIKQNTMSPEFLCERLNGIDNKDARGVFVDALICTNVDTDGCLIEAIYHRVDVERLFLLAEKTTDFGGCLKAAIEMIPNHPEILEMLIDKTEDTSHEFELALEKNKIDINTELKEMFYDEYRTYCGYIIAMEIKADVIYKLFAKAETISDKCLCYALSNDRGYSKEFLLELFRKTKNPVKALKAALGNKNTPQELLETIFVGAKKFGGCLAAALGCGRDLEMIERLFSKTTDFTGCLGSALKNGCYPLELYERLLVLAPEVLKCHHITNALKGCVAQEFVEKLLNLVDDAENSLGIAILRGYPADLLRKLYERTFYFEGCFWYIARSNTTEVPLDLMIKIIKRTGCSLADLYEKGTHSVELLRYVLNNRNGASERRILTIVERDYPIEFVGEMMNDSGEAFRHVGRLVELGCPVEFIEKHINKYSRVDGLDKVLDHGGFSVDFLIKLVDKSNGYNRTACLELAVKKGYPPILLDALLEKGGKIDGPCISPEYKKYYNTFHHNAECFICLLDFETEPSTGEITQVLPCHHKVHAACVENQTLDFKCPYH